MPRFETLIVGAHFRPPAKQLLAVLPPGHPLRLEEDNENAYDPAAVRVMLYLTDGNGMPLISEQVMAALAAELPNCGLTLEMLMSGGPVQLGFVPAQEGKPLARARVSNPEYLGNQQIRELMPDCQCTLGLTVDGGVNLVIETEPEMTLEVSPEARQV